VCVEIQHPVSLLFQTQDTAISAPRKLKHYLLLFCTWLHIKNTKHKSLHAGTTDAELKEENLRRYVLRNVWE